MSQTATRRKIVTSIRAHLVLLAVATGVIIAPHTDKRPPSRDRDGEAGPVGGFVISGREFLLFDPGTAYALEEAEWEAFLQARAERRRPRPGRAQALPGHLG